jgi:hypothetical protein
VGLPARRRAARAHPLVGGHRHSPPGHPVRRSRRAGADHAGVRGPGSHRRNRPAHPVRGPTVVFNLLLDGPQLTSATPASWPTTPAGRAHTDLVRNGRTFPTRRPGSLSGDRPGEGPHPRSPRDITRTRAQGVLLTVCMDRATRYSADRRWPVDNSTSGYGVAVHHIDRAGPRTRRPHRSHSLGRGRTEAAEYTPERLDQLLAAARPGAAWRTELDIPEPSPQRAAAIESLARIARAAPWAADASTFDALLTAAGQDHPADTSLDDLVRHVLLSMLEERRTRFEETTSLDNSATTRRRRPIPIPLSGYLDKPAHRWLDVGRCHPGVTAQRGLDCLALGLGDVVGVSQ